MHRHTNRLLTIALVACLSPVAFALQDDAAPAEEVSDGRALPDLKPIMEKVAEIYGLPFKQDVPAEEQSQEDFRAFLKAEIEKEYAEGGFEDVIDGLLRLGMLKERIELDDAFVDAFASQAAAYYDPESGKFYYLYADLPLDTLNIFAAHELTHALQDQHFGLDRIQNMLLEMANDESQPRNDDFILAVRCLIEGEATYVMNIYGMGEEAGNFASAAMANLSLAEIVEMSKAMFEAGEMEGDMAEAMESMEELPNYIVMPLYAAYMSGAGLTKQLRDAGGWERVRAAWHDLPPSTELCLHPEKLTGEAIDMPTTIALPEFDYLEEHGWQQIDSSIHGELYLGLMLTEQGVSARAARRASVGWDGDVYQAWRNEESDVAIVLATTWDEPSDAEQFLEAYREALGTKYPGFVATSDEGDASAMTFTCGEELGEGAVRLRSREVFVVEGFDAETVDRIMNDFDPIEIEYVGTIPAEPPGDDAVAVAHTEDEVALDGFSFTPDADWAAVEASSPMRVAPYELPAADGDAEPAQLIVFFFGDGHGGSYEANLERWKG